MARNIANRIQRNQCVDMDFGLCVALFIIPSFVNAKYAEIIDYTRIRSESQPQKHY